MYNIPESTAAIEVAYVFVVDDFDNRSLRGVAGRSGGCNGQDGGKDKL